MSTVISVPIAVAMEKSPVWKARGLVVTGSVLDELGLPIITIDAPADVLEEMAMSKMANQKSTQQMQKRFALAGILSRMYEAATAHPGDVQRHTMSRGMGIDLIV